MQIISMYMKRLFTALTWLGFCAILLAGIYWAIQPVISSPTDIHTGDWLTYDVVMRGSVIISSWVISLVVILLLKRKSKPKNRKKKSSPRKNSKAAIRKRIRNAYKLR